MSIVLGTVWQRDRLGPAAALPLRFTLRLSLLCLASSDIHQRLVHTKINVQKQQ